MEYRTCCFPYAAAMTSSLELPASSARRRPSRRVTTIALVAVAAFLPLSWIAWFANTPPGLTTNSRQASGSSVAGTPLYVGMYNAPSGFDRTIRVTGIKVDATASAETTIVPLLCRGGAVGVTTRPDQFCRELIDPSGETFGAEDSVVLEVDSAEAARVEIDRIRIGFHQDLRSATLPAGIAGAALTFTPPAG